MSLIHIGSGSPVPRIAIPDSSPSYLSKSRRIFVLSASFLHIVGIPIPFFCGSRVLETTVIVSGHPDDLSNHLYYRLLVGLQSRQQGRSGKGATRQLPLLTKIFGVPLDTFFRKKTLRALNNFFREKNLKMPVNIFFVQLEIEHLRHSFLFLLICAGIDIMKYLLGIILRLHFQSPP